MLISALSEYNGILGLHKLFTRRTPVQRRLPLPLLIEHYIFAAESYIFKFEPFLSAQHKQDTTSHLILIQQRYIKRQTKIL